MDQLLDGCFTALTAAASRSRKPALAWGQSLLPHDCGELGPNIVKSWHE